MADSDYGQVRTAINALPARQKQVVVMRFYEDMSPAEIGQALGITTNAVSVALSHAIRRIGALLERDEPDV